MKGAEHEITVEGYPLSRVSLYCNSAASATLKELFEFVYIIRPDLYD